jgi:hypothetical protein
MTQLLHTRPLSLTLIQSNVARSTLIPAFINKIFRALFDYRSSDSITYHCQLDDIISFAGIINYIRDVKREISSIHFSSALRDLGYTQAEIDNIESRTLSVLERLSKCEHESILVSDITSELARLMD